MLDLGRWQRVGAERVVGRTVAGPVAHVEVVHLVRGAERPRQPVDPRRARQHARATAGALAEQDGFGTGLGPDRREAARDEIEGLVPREPLPARSGAVFGVVRRSGWFTRCGWSWISGAARPFGHVRPPSGCSSSARKETARSPSTVITDGQPTPQSEQYVRIAVIEPPPRPAPSADRGCREVADPRGPGWPPARRATPRRHRRRRGSSR